MRRRICWMCGNVLDEPIVSLASFNIGSDLCSKCATLEDNERRII